MYAAFLVLAISLAFTARWVQHFHVADGPNGLPLLGSIFHFKHQHLHRQLFEWSRRYGDFFFYKMGLSRILVLSSPDAIEELCVKRGHLYSSRPPASGPANIVTAKARIVNLPYGNQFRRHRKILHNLLGMQNAKTFLPSQDYESHRALVNLLENPELFFTEMARYSGSVTFSLLLGARFDCSDALIPKAIGDKIVKFFDSIRPGVWLVDWIPILDYLPDSLAPWRRKAFQIQHELLSFWGVFYYDMKERVQNGTAPDCFVSRLLKQSDADELTETEKVSIIAELLSAGTETTATTLQCFFKAALIYPEFIEYAQQELDQVLGHGRMPTWEDQRSLPYIQAIITELHRWASITPVAFFHATSGPDEYRGQLIAPGTTVIPNVFAVHHGSDYFTEPQKFLPERFLPPDHPRFVPKAAYAARHYAFGIGRRECPGKHVAEASLYIVISRILWAFNIAPKPLSKPPTGSAGTLPIIGPKPFECSITPRNEKITELITSTLPGNPLLSDAAVYEGRLAALQKS